MVTPVRILGSSVDGLRSSEAATQAPSGAVVVNPTIFTNEKLPENVTVLF